ncbi:Uncharacterised protein [Chlamydia abortus]|nr:Uncharacterised protein [Chlamydia abortus]
MAFSVVSLFVPSFIEITPSIPTVAIASDINLPIKASLFADVVAICNTSSCGSA